MPRVTVANPGKNTKSFALVFQEIVERAERTPRIKPSLAISSAVEDRERLHDIINRRGVHGYPLLEVLGDFYPHAVVQKVQSSITYKKNAYRLSDGAIAIKLFEENDFYLDVYDYMEAKNISQLTARAQMRAGRQMLADILGLATARNANEMRFIDRSDIAKAMANHESGIRRQGGRAHHLMSYYFTLEVLTGKPVEMPEDVVNAIDQYKHLREVSDGAVERRFIEPRPVSRHLL
jgi:hypothetical protein